jgi:hypothetical protein
MVIHRPEGLSALPNFALTLLFVSLLFVERCDERDENVRIAVPLADNFDNFVRSFEYANKEAKGDACKTHCIVVKFHWRFQI